MDIEIIPTQMQIDFKIVRRFNKHSSFRKKMNFLQLLHGYCLCDYSNLREVGVLATHFIFMKPMFNISIHF